MAQTFIFLMSAWAVVVAHIGKWALYAPTEYFQLTARQSRPDSIILVKTWAPIREYDKYRRAVHRNCESGLLGLKKEGSMVEERLKLAVFIDFDNIQIGVKDTLGKDFDVSLVLEALKERGEVVTKVAYGDWPRAGEQSRHMTQHAVQMVQRNVTPRGDKNGADINLALDALEMAFTRHHISGFAIVGGDSDFIALVEKLKQYDKRVFVVGGRAFTSNILQRNCTEFIAYENLLRGGAGADGSRSARSSRRGAPAGRGSLEARSLQEAFPNVQRALQILAARGVSPQIGLLKSTLLQLDSTFTERDFGAGSFLEFMQKMERARLVHLRRTDQGFLVEPVNGDETRAPDTSESRGSETQDRAGAERGPLDSGLQLFAELPASGVEALELLRRALATANLRAPNRPVYLRQLRQALRSADKNFDERRYGQRGVLDLLYQAQREGLVKLQRDRKGVLRIFPIGAAHLAPSRAATEGALAAPPTAVASLEAGITEEIPAPEEVADDMALPEVPPLANELTVETEGATGPKVRRPRTSGVPAKGSRRRASSRRKPKEPTQN